LNKAITAIDTYMAEELITRGSTKVREELTELFGVGAAIE
jgi:hypothetical protein